MSFEIRDLMVKLSPVQGSDYGQLPCTGCQTTACPPQCELGSLCLDTQCPETASMAPDEGYKTPDKPAPEPEKESPEKESPEKEAGPRPGMAFALLQSQLRQTLSQQAV